MRLIGFAAGYNSIINDATRRSSRQKPLFFHPTEMSLASALSRTNYNDIATRQLPLVCNGINHSKWKTVKYIIKSIIHIWYTRKWYAVIGVAHAQVSIYIFLTYSTFFSFHPFTVMRPVRVIPSTSSYHSHRASIRIFFSLLLCHGLIELHLNNYSSGLLTSNKAPVTSFSAAPNSAQKFPFSPVLSIICVCQALFVWNNFPFIFEK